VFGDPIFAELSSLADVVHPCRSKGREMAVAAFPDAAEQMGDIRMKAPTRSWFDAFVAIGYALCESAIHE